MTGESLIGKVGLMAAEGSPEEPEQKKKKKKKGTADQVLHK